MIASAIAYSLSVLFFASGAYGLYNVGCGKYPKGEETKRIKQNIFAIVVAWLVAYLGGI